MWLEFVDKEQVSKDEAGGGPRPLRGPREETRFRSQYRATFETETAF